MVVFCVLYIYLKKHKCLAWSRGVEEEAGGCGPACISAESASCTVYSVLITWFDIFSQTLIVNHTGWWLLLADL